MTLLTSCPARATSTTLTMDTMEVFFTACTANPTVGGVAIRTACGSTTPPIV